MFQRKLTQEAFKRGTQEVPTEDIPGASPSHKALSITVFFQIALPLLLARRWRVLEMKELIVIENIAVHFITCPRVVSRVFYGIYSYTKIQHNVR
jgi:hypothetical protein